MLSSTNVENGHEKNVIFFPINLSTPLLPWQDSSILSLPTFFLDQIFVNLN